MKVVIVTAYYAPLNVPRAFRAIELAHELSRREHEVTVINATTLTDSYGKDLVIEEMNGVKLINLGIVKLQDLQNKNEKFIKYGKWKNRAKKISYYFTTNRWLLFYKELKKHLTFNEKYDLLISIGLPFAVHWGVADKIKGRNIADCYVADYGDPFSRNNKSIRVAKYFQWIERRCIAKYDFISIPTIKALDSYLWLKPKEKIRVIPQGFDYTCVKCAEYVRNEIPTFAYAGLFYSDIRNPSVLFQYLCKCKTDFRFIVYTDTSVSDSFLCIKPYIMQLGSKLEIRNTIPRLDLIYQLSKVDFIINVNNLASNQTPSKLIDYSLSKRPIFSFFPNQFEENRFSKFLSYKFDGNDAIDISSFNIVRVANQFEDLYKSMNK